MSDESGEKATDHTQTKSNSISVEDIIRQAVQGISKELPSLIDAHLKVREGDSISTTASDDIDENENQEDASALNQEQGDVSAQNGIQEGVSTSKQTTEDAGSSKLNTDYHNKEFDRVSSLFGIGETRKRKISAPNMVVSNELLDLIEEDLGMEKESGEAINTRWAEQIHHSYIEAASETSALNKIMKLYPRPNNLDIKVPKLNREVELNTNFQKNERYVNTKEKQLYNTQNYVQKTINILAGLGQNLLDDSDSQGGAVNHKDMVQKCIHAVTLLGHVQAELSQKRRNNIRSIVNYNYAALCGPRPGSQAAKKKPKNEKCEYLLGDSLKTDAKMAKAATDMFRKSERSGSSSEKRPRMREPSTSSNHFLDHGRKGNGNRNSQRRSADNYNRNNNNRQSKTKGK